MEFGDHNLGIWDTFERCSSHDETAAISCKVEKGGKLYDIQTIGCILPSEPAFRNPTVSLVQSTGQDLCVVADSFISLLSNEGLDCKSTINIGCRVDALCFRPDGQMVIIADSAGVVHIASGTSGNVIFSHKVTDPESNVNHSNNRRSLTEELDERGLFCAVTCHDIIGEKDSYCIAVALTCARFFVFDNVKLAMLEEAYNKRDMPMGEKAQGLMRMQEYNSSLIKMTAMTTMITAHDGFCNYFITMGKGQNILAVWEQNNDPIYFCPDVAPLPLTCTRTASSDHICVDYSITMVKGYHLLQYLYTLDSTGCLYQWYSVNLELRRCWRDVGIVDFTVVFTGNTSRSDGGRLYAFVADKSKVHDSILSVFELPTMECCFTFAPKGQSLCRMVSGPPFVEDVVFIDAEAGRDNIASRLCLRSIVEASPEDRLFRLLNKHRFDEAENFALSFKLDLQQVYQQKATYLSSVISTSYENDDLCNEIFNQLMDCLAKIKDPIMVAELCLEAVLPDIRHSYRLLTLGRSRLSNVNGDHMRLGSVNDSDMVGQENQLRLKIIHQLDRLVTFRMAHGHGRSPSDGDWLHFCSADLPMELVRLLSSGNINAAAIVLLRHKASLLNFLSSVDSASEDEKIVGKRLLNFLECIPESADVDVVVAWLEDSLVPILLTRVPDSLRVLAVWLHSRAEAFEQSKPSDWPENGLKMANVLSNVQNRLSGLGFMRDQVSGGSQPFKSTTIEVSNVRLLASRLQLLLQLKQKYKCNVTLSEFVQETTMSLTYRMLDRVMVPELVPSILKVTVRPYMREHGLEEEEVLLGYVEDMLSRFRDRAWGTIESLEERKVTAIIKCMQDPMKAFEAIVKLAKKASIPWSDEIHELAKRGLEITDSDVTNDTIDTDCEFNDAYGEIEMSLKKKREFLLKELQNCIYIERLPKVLSEYGLSNVEARNSSSQLQIIRFLIHRGTPESLAQAYQFCHAFTSVSDIDMYRFRLLFLLEKHKVEDCVNLLTEVMRENPKLTHSVVRHIICFAEGMLATTDKLFKKERETYCSAAILMIECMLGQSDRKRKSSDGGEERKFDPFENEIRSELILLNNILNLQTKYNELVSIEEYLDEDFVDKLLARHITVSISDSSSEPNKCVTLSTSLFGDSSSIGNATTVQTDTSKLPQGETFVNKLSGDAADLSHVLNVAHILGVESDKLRGRLALHSAKKGSVGAKAAISMCKDLFRVSPTTYTAETAFSVVLALLKCSSTQSSYYIRLIPELIEVTASALMHLDPDRVQEGLELCRFLILCNEVCKITDVAGDSFLSQQTASYKNPFESIATVHPWMEETGGLMLRSEQVLPLFFKTAEILINGGDILSCRQVDDIKSIDASICNLHDVASEMASVLQLARQPQLALYWIMTCIRVSLFHIASQWDSEAEEKSKALISRMVNVLDQGNKLLPGYIDECVKKALSAKEVDVSLLVGLLTMIPIARAHTLLQSELTKAGNKYRRIMYITTVGIATLKLNAMHVQVKKFEHLFLDSCWGERLRTMNISFEKLLFSPPASKSILLPRIIHHPDASGKLIKDFCTDFELDSNLALLEFARVLLADPSCTVGGFEKNLALTGVNGSLEEDAGALISPVTLNFQRSNMLIMTPEGNATSRRQNKNVAEEEIPEEEWQRPFSDVKKEMSFIMKNIDDMHELCRQLIRILRTEISPYFYRRAKFILHLITECHVDQTEVNVKKGTDLVECLELVKRVKSVSDYEHQHWSLNTETHTTRNLPALAKQRLPLHPLLFGDSGSAWKILTPELNERSASRLVPVARILSLSINKLYMTSADNFIKSHLDKNKERHLNMNAKQLAAIRSLTKEMDDYRMATAMAKRIAELLPISEDKVKAYEWCKSISQEWLSSLASDDLDRATVVNAHRSLSAFHSNAATELVLQKYNLAAPETTALIFYPEKLIFTLYQHKSIVERYHQPDATVYPDIHQATNEIADIHSINILKLRIAISKEWLFSVKLSDEKDDEDSTINLANMRATSILNTGCRSCTFIGNDVIHLLYVSSHAVNRQTACFLLGFAFDRKNPQITNLCRVRSLQCVLQLFDDEILEEITKEKVSTIREKLRILVYLSELEAVGFPVHGSRLESGDKDEVARSILASPELRHQPRAIRVVAELCREYDSWFPGTWQLILQQMVALRQIGYLHQLLPDIACNPSISSLSCLPTVWQSCVTFPLTSMTAPLSEDEVKVAMASYHLLLGCPVLLQIDLKQVAQHFCSVDLPLLGLGCLLSDPSQDENARKLAKLKRELIHDQLKQLSTVNHPILGQAQIVDVLNALAL